MRGLTSFCLTILFAVAICGRALAETDQEVAAREVALELAGAFANDGFKLRDGTSGSISALGGAARSPAAKAH